MMKLRRALFAIALSALALNAKAQNAADLELAGELNKKQPAKNYRYRYQASNEAEETLRLLFNFYKSYISSQDQQTCNFQPSCSVYALHSFETLGWLEGFLNTLDRLSRCHPLALEHYARDPQSGLALDPIRPQ